MSWKTLMALIAFSFLTSSLMMDKSTRRLATKSTSTQESARFNFDVALTSQELVFSEALKQDSSRAYLIPAFEYEELKSHSAEVILKSLSALPNGDSSPLILSRK